MAKTKIDFARCHTSKFPASSEPRANHSEVYWPKNLNVYKLSDRALTCLVNISSIGNYLNGQFKRVSQHSAKPSQRSDLLLTKRWNLALKAIRSSSHEVMNFVQNALLTLGGIAPDEFHKSKNAKELKSKLRELDISLGPVKLPGISRQEDAAMKTDRAIRRTTILQMLKRAENLLDNYEEEMKCAKSAGEKRFLRKTHTPDRIEALKKEIDSLEFTLNLFDNESIKLMMAKGEKMGSD